jgi:rubrerythrin
MKIQDFLDLAEEIELKISDLYTIIAGNSADPPMANQLKKLAAEEINHANILRTGKAYYEAMPDLFAGLTMDEAEVRAALKEALEHQAAFLQKKPPIHHQLQTMMAFEKRFEKFHMGAAVKIEDQKLRQLFMSLRKGDHSHITMLDALIATLQEKP